LLIVLYAGRFSWRSDDRGLAERNSHSCYSAHLGICGHAFCGPSQTQSGQTARRHARLRPQLV